MFSNIQAAASKQLAKNSLRRTTLFSSYFSEADGYVRREVKNQLQMMLERSHSP